MTTLNDTHRRRFLLQLGILICTAGIVLYWLLAVVDWSTFGDVPAGDPELVPAGIVETIPDSTSSSSTVPPSTSTSSSTTSTSSSTTSTLPIPAGVACPELIPIARAVGWPETELDTLDRIAYRESRCDSTVTNLEGRDRSYGLTQINVKGSLWAHRSELCGLRVPDDLLNPATNLACALQLWQLSGWQPWGGSI